MIRQSVSDSDLQSVGYDPASRILEIAFRNGSVYQFSGVPYTEHKGLMRADSKGQFFRQHIKNIYQFRNG